MGPGIARSAGWSTECGKGDIDPIESDIELRESADVEPTTGGGENDLGGGEYLPVANGGIDFTI
jgi:hypothetical protein